MAPRETAEWLLVFVKAPSPTEVKTRLTSQLSPEDAAYLYRCLVRDTLEVARRLTRAHLVIAYAANREFPDVRWLDEPPPMFLQHGRSLGERLGHAFRWAFDQRARRVVVMGSDAPEISASWIRQAFGRLARYDVVLGPTEDGGYHLIGLTQPHPELFEEMPWSTPKLLGQTIQRIGQLGLSVACLESVADLDTPEDVSRVMARLNARTARTHTARYLHSRARHLVGVPSR